MSEPVTEQYFIPNGADAQCLERVTGIEPAFSAWEADVLPLNYTREGAPRYQPRPQAFTPIVGRALVRV